MKNGILVVLIALVSQSAVAADHYYVTGEAEKIVATAADSHFCEDSAENRKIIETTVETLKSDASLVATSNCGAYEAIPGRPRAVLVQDYKTSVFCMAFGSRMEISVSGVFECVQ